MDQLHFQPPRVLRHREPDGRRILVSQGPSRAQDNQVRYNNVPVDRPGRYFYIKDMETGAFWSPTWVWDDYQGESRGQMFE